MRAETYTKASELSAALFHPDPTETVGAAVNVGTGRVLIVPVAVYVGKRAICVPEKEGESVVGGKEWRDA